MAQAFALAGARSLLTLEAARLAGRKAQSNIRWSYGHETIPRHLRDVFVTEYGVADVRGKSDEDVIALMLAIADSRFQDELARQAKDAGKLAQRRLGVADAAPGVAAAVYLARQVVQRRDRLCSVEVILHRSDKAFAEGSAIDGVAAAAGARYLVARRQQPGEGVTQNRIVINHQYTLARR